jgi:hypothetical protein
MSQALFRDDGQTFKLAEGNCWEFDDSLEDPGYKGGRNE